MKWLLVLLFLLVCLPADASPKCDLWFLKTGISPGTRDCLLRCSTHSADLATFTCPNECEDLCKAFLPRDLLNELTYPPGLTEADKDLLAKYPKDASVVYLAKWRVEEATSRIFGDSFRNDRSDAFRHFVWAGMLTKEIGEEKANMFLMAHEMRSNQPKDEFEMDTYNNQQGIAEALRLLNHGEFKQSDLEKIALQALKNERLKVIDKSGKVPDWKNK